MRRSHAGHDLLAETAHTLLMLCCVRRRSRSNFGNKTVDVAAPGDNVVSTYIGSDNPYTTMTGTSVAVPHVSGTAALLLSQCALSCCQGPTPGPSLAQAVLVERYLGQSV
jgi:hypothetical protein